MPQDPFLTDQVKIEPGSGQILTISRDATTGSLHFVDNVITGGINLNQLAGLGSVSNMLVVGKAGAGATYTTIQAAMDVVPVSASATNPYIILVMGGVYDETVNIVRDGVRLVGVGRPTLRSALESTPDAVGNDHTLIISAQLGTTPLSTLIQGFGITNAHSGKACIRVAGAAASTLCNQGLLINDCDLGANSASGNYSLWATAANTINVNGGAWVEDNNLGQLRIEEVTWFQAYGVDSLGAITLRYDTGENEPANGANSYNFINCGPIAANTAMPNPVLIDLDGNGNGVFEGCSITGQLTLSGDQSVQFKQCVTEDLSILETAQVLAQNTTIDGAIVAANAAASLTPQNKKGTTNFTATATAAEVFDIPQADAQYLVVMELPSQPVNDETPWITAKTGAGFTINFNTAQTMDVDWVAIRL